jgi:N-acetylneuraminate lyase
LAKHAEEVGAFGIASIAPSFFKPASVTDLVDFFAPIANSAPNLPFYYYNMPAMTGVSLPVEKFLAEGKKKIASLAGIKFTHNNMMEMNVCMNFDSQFQILHGYDETLLTGLALGAVAGVGSTYNYIPHVYDGIFTAMQSCDLEKARMLQMQSVKMVEVIIKYGGGVRGGKAIMNHIGIACGDCRLPISPMSKEEITSLERDLESIDFFTK